MLHQTMVPAPLAVVMLEAGDPPNPSVGAHRLVWWLLEQRDLLASANRVALLSGLGVDRLERVVLGEIEPEDDAAQRIAAATGGAVLPEDWSRRSQRPWAHAPAFRARPRPGSVQ
ncbi:hypothetical protein [Sphingomonas sp. S2-65]|uniref:hypothetical protein n=1 Tax=Sphingomonas sp. S2-65 TaxID=2903960 RepID=UPI001F169E8E|nr:hypothetical protein [Sphingomonas sp. S2-65]UYY60126.1 hypothetical protein LZ586_08630 [Sphingomonas sp. S2-65]